MMVKIGSVPKEVRNAVLDVYLIRTMKLHNVAFFQWRLMYPPKYQHEYYNKDELRDLIEEKFNYFINLTQYDKKPLKETR